MLHDSSQNYCSNTGEIMTAYLGGGDPAKRTQWTECSANELALFRRSGGTHCLRENHTDSELFRPAYAGFHVTLNDQCKSKFGKHSVAHHCWNSASVGACSWLQL